MQRPRVELQPDDGKDKDGEHDEEADLHERCQGLEDGLEDHLQAWERRGGGRGEKKYGLMYVCTGKALDYY